MGGNIAADPCVTRWSKAAFMCSNCGLGDLSRNLACDVAAGCLAAQTISTP